MIVATLCTLVGVVLWPGSSRARSRLCSTRPAGAAIESVGVDRRLRGHGPETGKRRHHETTAALRGLAGALRSGATPRDALLAAAEEAPALGGLLRVAADGVARGADPGAALSRVGGGVGCAGLAAAGAVWSAAAPTGAPVAGLLDRLADGYDADDACRAELRANVAGARATMVVLAALPVAGVGLGTWIGASPVVWLSTRPAGAVTALLALALDVAGWLWARRLLAGALR